MKLTAMACQGFAHIKHLMRSAVWHGRFSCGFCSRLGFGDNIERAEQRRSRHLGPGFRGWNFRRPTGCVFFVGNIWMFPKIVGFPPKSSIFNRVFHYFHHPFWGYTPIFGNTHMDDWVALMEDSLGFGGCVFITPPQRKKKGPVTSGDGEETWFYFKMYFFGKVHTFWEEFELESFVFNWTGWEIKCKNCGRKHPGEQHICF